MKLIVLDTNFLIYLIRYRIDLEDELRRVCEFRYKIVLPKQVVLELNFLSKEARLKDREAATLALEIIKNYEVVEVEAKNADEAVFELSSENILATMDKEIRKRFKKEKRGSLLSIRQKKYLVLN